MVEVSKLNRSAAGAAPPTMENSMRSSSSSVVPFQNIDPAAERSKHNDFHTTGMSVVGWSVAVVPVFGSIMRYTCGEDRNPDVSLPPEVHLLICEIAWCGH